MRWNNKTGLIGVDIGTHAVKLAQVERRGHGFALREAAVVLRREPWKAEDWQSAPPRSSVDEIFACRALGSGFQGRQAACAVPMAVCDVRGMNVRVGDARQQRTIIEGDLRSVWRQDAPFAFDSWSIPQISASIQDNVNVLSAPRGWSDQIASDHGKAKLACQVMDGVPLALARAVRLASDNTNGTLVAALDWGFTRATFCLIRDGQPVFVRCFRDAGFRGLIDALCNSLGIADGEAQQVLRQYGLPDSSSTEVELQQLIADVAADAIEGICAEMKRTLLFLRSHLSGNLPQQVYLFGGGASVQRMDTELTKRIELPVTVWQPKLQYTAESAAKNCPLSLLGPAMALSMLAWE